MQGSIEELYFPSATGQGDIYARLWLPGEQPVAIVQIAHGMAEHVLRYDAFGAYFAEQGIAVAANDHAGHGKSIGEKGIQGYFGPQDGWNNVVKDILTLREMLQQRFPGVPYILLGHSMGSFLARTIAGRAQAEGIAAFIFSGTAGKNPAVSAGKLVARMERSRNGAHMPSKLLHNMSFGSYNKAFAPNRTSTDWLSCDEAIVDAYEADPLCGFPFTAEAMSDLFDGLTEISSQEWAARVSHVPILLISGGKDPVGSFGKGVRQVEGWLQKGGHAPKVLLYPEGRHEMHNELNKLDVYAELLAFIRSVTGIV